VKKLDGKAVPDKPGEIRAFISMRNERIRLPQWLDYYRALGVARFFVIDNVSDDGSTEFVLEQPDCHCFLAEGSYFAENVDPPNWQNTALNVHGDGYWCVTVDADELLIYPHCETLGLPDLCRYLDKKLADAFIADMIDMYGSGPIAAAEFRPGDSFIEAAPFFDPKPGWLQQRDNSYPPELMFGGVRERALWPGRFKRTLPPCLTKVPLAKWRKGRQYLVSCHTIDHAIFSELRGALLHFKFLLNFKDASSTSVHLNQAVQEKGLQERQAYLETLQKSPNLTLRNEQSVRYKDSAQLIELGWLKTSQAFEDFVVG